MEVIVRIKEQAPAVVRGDRNKFTIVGFKLLHGSDEFFAEMVKEGEQQVSTLSKDFYYVASIQFSTRDYKDKNNNDRFENRIRLNRLDVL